MKKFAAVLLALIVVAGFGYYILFLQLGTPDRTLYGVDLDDVRELATSLDGPLPVAINAEAPVTLSFPGAAVVTGWPWRANPMVIYAYQVVYPNGHIMIDTAMSADQTSVIAGDDIPFDEEAYARLEKAVGDADSIIFTHEHFDHIGGAIAHPDAVALLDRVRLTGRQVSQPDPYWGGLSYPEGALEGYEPLTYDRVRAFAPGMVLIEAAGHTPGSQIIYVKTASGQEYLFVGDVAWNYAGINLVRPRPNIVSWFFLEEDRPRTHAQVAELKALAKENPELEIIVGHDGPRTRDQMARGLIGDRFQ